MVKMARKNPKAFEQILSRAKQLDGAVAKAGWFSTDKYEDGTPVAYIASVQEFGAHINHPGGTPFFVSSDGSAHFVRKNTAFASNLPTTKAHTIIIPPRPFMRPTAARDRKDWIKIMADGSKKVMQGKLTADQVMWGLGAAAAGGIKESIVAVTAPPLKPGTIAARKRQMADKKTVGNLSKPLVHSGIMLDTVTHTNERE